MVREALGPVVADELVPLVNGGVCFLRSICKLTHRGHAQYVKGDGDAFADFLAKNYPGYSNDCLSRADYSNRQDWSLEAAFEIFPLLEPLLDYEVKSLLDEANVLRDSILIQLETLHFEAYCHVCALMWRVVFAELRGLTNSTGLEIDPLTLNVIYEHLYDLGKLLQTDKALTILDTMFRPWPHIYQNKKRSKHFYTRLERDLQADLTRLRAYRQRPDVDKYEEMLRVVLRLFGEGIIASLEFTMKDYLKQTKGRLRTDVREEWELIMCRAMLCHNNAAERPFAVLRQYKRLYPSLSIENLAKLTHSLVNGSHRPGSSEFKAGIALTSDPRLRKAIVNLCSVKRKTAGIVTKFIRAELKADKEELCEVRKQKTEARFEDNIRKKAKRAAIRDHAETILHTSLVTSIAELNTQLQARCNSSSARITFLKEQFHARVSGESPRDYRGLGREFRGVHGKLKITPSDGTTGDEFFRILPLALP